MGAAARREVEVADRDDADVGGDLGIAAQRAAPRARRASGTTRGSRGRRRSRSFARSSAAASSASGMRSRCDVDRAARARRAAPTPSPRPARSSSAPDSRCCAVCCAMCWRRRAQSSSPVTPAPTSRRGRREHVDDRAIVGLLGVDDLDARRACRDRRADRRPRDRTRSGRGSPPASRRGWSPRRRCPRTCAARRPRDTGGGSASARIYHGPIVMTHESQPPGPSSPPILPRVGQPSSCSSVRRIWALSALSSSRTSASGSAVLP